MSTPAASTTTNTSGRRLTHAEVSQAYGGKRRMTHDEISKHFGGKKKWEEEARRKKIITIAVGGAVAVAATVASVLYFRKSKSSSK